MINAADAIISESKHKTTRATVAEIQAELDPERDAEFISEILMPLSEVDGVSLYKTKDRSAIAGIRWHCKWRL